MKATDLVKSLALSSIKNEDMKVVTFYKNQSKEAFLRDNFGADARCCSNDLNLRAPYIVSSQDYLAVYNRVPLATPDGKSTLLPDYEIEERYGITVCLYAFA